MWLDSWSKRIKLTIDGSKINGALIIQMLLLFLMNWLLYLGLKK